MIVFAETVGDQIWLTAEAAEELARDLLRAVEEATDHEEPYLVSIMENTNKIQRIFVKPKRE